MNSTQTTIMTIDDFHPLPLPERTPEPSIAALTLRELADLILVVMTLCSFVIFLMSASFAGVFYVIEFVFSPK